MKINPLVTYMSIHVTYFNMSLAKLFILPLKYSVNFIHSITYKIQLFVMKKCKYQAREPY